MEFLPRAIRGRVVASKITNSGGTEIIKQIKHRFNLLDMKQKSKVNYFTLKLYSREIDLLAYLEESMNYDFISIGLRYIFILLTQFPDLQEVDDDKFELIKSLFCDCWAVHSSRSDELGFDDSLILYLLKDGELMHKNEQSANRASGISRIVRKSILSELDWTKNHISSYVGFTEFWIKMFSDNISFYKNTPNALEWMLKSSNESHLSIDRDDTGGLLRKKTFDGETKSEKTTIFEVSLTEEVRWLISYGCDITKINKICKTASKKFGIRNSTVQHVLLKCEDILLEKVKHIGQSTKDRVETTRYSWCVRMFQYLDVVSCVNYATISKEYYRIFKLPLLKYVLGYCSFTQDIRLSIWNSLIDDDIRGRKLRTNLKVDERLEELIEMDLNRSLDFFDQSHYQDVKLILINIAEDFPEVSYYQGMNYLAIFLFHTFDKNSLSAFHFFSYMIDSLLQKYFGQSFQGILKLIFVVDKLLEQIYPNIWSKLSKGQVTAIHFSVPNLITLFTSLIKSKEAYLHIYEIWDTIISQGVSCLIKSLLLLLELQQSDLFSITSDNLLLVMKNVEKDPFAIVKYRGIKDVSRYIDELTKSNILGLKVTDGMIEHLEQMFEKVRKPILDEWESSTRY